MAIKSSILIIDADPSSAGQLAPALQDAGFTPIARDHGDAGLQHLRASPPDALLLDPDLPDMSGLDALETARAFFLRPILILSRRGATADKVAALDLGADDYLQKPVDPIELLARLRAVSRNKLSRDTGSLVVRAADVEIDMGRRIVVRSGREVRLSTREYQLLIELAKSAGKVITHRRLLTAVWGPDRGDNIEYLRVFIQQLRQKLESDPSSPVLIVTETGVGYRFRG